MHLGKILLKSKVISSLVVTSLTLALSQLISFQALAKFQGGQNMKSNPTAAKGICLIPVIKNKYQAQDLLDAYKITVSELVPKPPPPPPIADGNVEAEATSPTAKATKIASPPNNQKKKIEIVYKTIPQKERHLTTEKIALAKGLAQITALNGGRFKAFKRTHIEFANRTGWSTQDGMRTKGVYHISMNRCDFYGNECTANSVSHMIHELGHQLGNESMPSGETYYQAYNRLVSGFCEVTMYSNDNSNEQFAEAFSTFVTYPELLRDATDPICKRAYAFFATDVFAHNGMMQACSKPAKAQLLAVWSEVTRQTEVAMTDEQLRENGYDPAKLKPVKSKKKKSKIPVSIPTIVRFKVIETPPHPKVTIPLPIRNPLRVEQTKTKILSKP